MSQKPVKKPIKGDPIKGYYHQYGWNWDPIMAKNPFFVELAMFRSGATPTEKPFHFKKICSFLWPNTKDSPKRFFFNEWTDKMLENACKWNYLGVLGSGSSGKSDFFAVWAIVNYK